MPNMISHNYMPHHLAPELLFLSWESPWPPMGGGTLRTLGLLRQLSKVFSIHLLVLSKGSLSENQKEKLQSYADSIERAPMAVASRADGGRILARMLAGRMPYHCAVIDLSFRRAPEVLERVRSFPGVVYASFGHWGTLVRGHDASNWILDQQNADVDFWRVYASQATSLWLKLAALVNWRLAAAHFPSIYSSVGRVVSVCEEDRQLTLNLAPHAQVDVIENGVDCDYYKPNRMARSGPPRLLFTGTSAPRNVTALRQLTRDVWPLVRKELPEAELLVAGNFKPEAQVEFRHYSNVHFTGRVEDMRPYFNQSDVFGAPFAETHGSKLKIAEAMAMAMPIVSTPEGIRGFALVDGESVLIAHSPEEFAAQAVSLLRDPLRREKLGTAARETALTTVDWGVLGTRLVELVQATQQAQV